MATKSGPRKLSEVARHVVIPAGIVATGWPSVRDRCAQFGIGFDFWQDGIGRLVLAKRADGKYACSVGGAVLSIPRQTGKTYFAGWLVFALCTLVPGLTVIWTAHHSRTSNETFAKMQTMARRKKVEPYIQAVRASHGEQQVSFKNGSRIMFGARESGFGRGFDKVDVLILDEGQILTENAMTDMVPATNAAPNGLVILMGTPPRPKDPGEVFLNRRQDALDGDKDTLFVEFSADPSAKIIDWAQLEKANPSFPHRTDRTAILRMQKLLGSDDNFRREAYGIWDEELKSRKAIPSKPWSVLAVGAGKVPAVGRKVFGVKFSSDGAHVALAGAIRPDVGPVHVEGIRQENMGSGTSWLVDFLAARRSEVSLIVVDGKAGVGLLTNLLADAGVRGKVVHVPSLDEVISAHSIFLNSVATGDLTHSGQSELDDQVRVAVRRKIGNNGGFGWEGSDTAVTLLDAVTLAFWGAKTTKRNAGREQRFL